MNTATHDLDSRRDNAGAAQSRGCQHLEQHRRPIDSRLTYVYRQRVRCPVCGSAELQTLRSVKDQGDGSTLRVTRCRKCCHRFRLVIED